MTGRKLRRLGLTVVLVLAGCGPSVESSGDNSIYMFAAQGQLGVVRQGLEEGFGVNTPDTDGRTLLHYAVAGGQSEVLEYLIVQYRANATIPDAAGRTAIDLARELGDQNSLNVFQSEGLLE